MRIKLFSLIIFLSTIPSHYGYSQIDKSKSPRPELRPLMLSIKSSLDALIPAASTDGYADKANQAAIESNLKALTSSGAALKSHVSSDRTALRFYGIALDFTSKQAYSRYQQGEYKESQFFTLQMVEACTGCHSALPSSSSSVPSKMFSIDASAKLSKLEKARLLVASRKFDDALGAYEEMLTSANYINSSVVFLNPFLEYLTVAVRVRNNMVRPLKTLLRIIEKPNIPSSVRHDLTGWTRSLQQLIKPPNLKKPLISEAKQIIDQGKTLMEYPYDRAGLVHYLYASGLLQQFLDSVPTNNELVAQAYYLLGTTELLTGRSFWLSLADPYFEAAITAAPGAAPARNAFSALEQNILLNGAAQDTGELNKEDQARLNRLRTLAFKGDKK